MSVLDGLKNIGGKIGKGFLIEAFVAYNEKDLNEGLKRILDEAGISAEDIPDFVYSKRALPIPQEAFTALKGLEDYIETVGPERLYEWLTKARPDIGLALAACGDEGAEYMVRLKYFFVDSIIAAPLPDEETEEGLPETDAAQPETDEAPQTYPVRCNGCGEVVHLTKAEIAVLEECPNCHEPADLNP